MSKLQFKLASLLDAKVISELIHSAYREEGSRVGWTTEEHLVEGARVTIEDVEGIIREPDNFFILGYDEDQIKGCVHFKKESAQTTYLGLLAVKPKLQTQGLGKAMISTVEKMALEMGTSKIRLTVIDVRSELISYYQRRGFELTGEIVPFPFPELTKQQGIRLLEMQKVLKS